MAPEVTHPTLGPSTFVVKYIRKKAEDQLLISFFNNVFRITNVVIAILIFMYIVGMGKIAGSILGAAGVSAFIIGFAFKDIAA